jgi:hypothetical protein
MKVDEDDLPSPVSLWWTKNEVYLPSDSQETSFKEAFIMKNSPNEVYEEEDQGVSKEQIAR